MVGRGATPMRNAAPCRTEKSFFLGSARGPPGFRFVAKQMRRLSDLCCGPGRQDVLTGTDVDTQSDEEELPQEDWAAYREAKKQAKDLPRMQSANHKGAKETKGDGQVLNDFNRRTGARNRCYARDSEYRLSPKCPWRKLEAE